MRTRFEKFFPTGLPVLLVTLLVMLLGVTSPLRAEEDEVHPDDKPSVGASLGGVLGGIMLHETGHGVAAAISGWKIESFRPFPHICGGRLVGGCVESRPDEKPGSRALRRESTFVSAMGSMTSVLAVTALAPSLEKMERGNQRNMLYSMLTFQVADFPIYLVTDTFTDFEGDWSSVSKNTGVHILFFWPLAAAQFSLQSRYLAHYWKRATDKSDAKEAEEKAKNAAAFVLPLRLAW